MKPTFTQGKYQATITKWALGESNKKKTPQFCITFMPQGILNAQGGLDPCPQFERSLYLYFTENTIENVVRDLRERLGYDRDGFDYLDPEHPQAFPLGGKRIEVECKHEEYDGEQKERWGFPFGGSVSTPLDRKGISQLNAMFGKALKGGASNGNRTPIPPASESPSVKEYQEATKQAEEVF